MQSISHRTLSGSFYYIFQDEMLRIFTPPSGSLRCRGLGAC